MSHPHDGPISQAQLQDLAVKTLDCEGETVPPFCLPILAWYLEINPRDDNFILELAEKGKSGSGGNGFGTVTCMEDYCWMDVILDADPERPDGGRKDGLGSLFNYQVHCQNEKHAKGRNERLAKQGIPLPAPAADIFERRSGPSGSSHQSLRPGHPASASPAAASRPDAAPSSSSTSQKPMVPRQPSTSLLDALDDLSPLDLASSDSRIPFPSRTTSRPSATSRKTVASNRSTSSVDRKPFFSSALTSSPLSQRSSNVPHTSTQADKEVKPTASQLSRLDYGQDTGGRHPREPIMVNSDTDDDDVMAIPASQIPEEFRRVTNRDNPFTVDDDDEETLGADTNTVSLEDTRRQLEAANRRLEQDSIQWQTGQVPGYLAPPNAPAYPSQVTTTGPARSDPDIISLSPSLKMHMCTIEKRIMKRLTTYAMASPDADLRQAFLARLQLLNHIALHHSPDLYHRPPEILLSAFDELRVHIRAWDKTAVTMLSLAVTSFVSRGNPTVGNGAIAGPSSAFPFSMPGAFPEDSKALVLGSMPSPSNLFDDGEHEYGYELDRPVNAKDLSNLFQTALDDFQEDIKVEVALQGLGLTSLEDKLGSLKISLMPHQVMGVHWMVEQEKKKRNPGGILGDEMGLGKTVQALATMIKNPSQDRKVKSTLIILPAALLQQWKSEIESKSDLTAHIHHGSGKTKSVNYLKSQAVVLTTYGTMTAERGGDLNKKKRKTRQSERDGTPDSFLEDDDDEPAFKPKGLLFRVHWYRVILDEAAQIRNKNTVASKAVVQLDSEIKWCLTGTLIYNTLSDIFPYLRFIGVIEWAEFSIRVHRIAARKPRLAAKRAQALLRKVMLRRTKESEINGKKILQLPPKDIEMLYLQLSPEERATYASVEQRARVRVNKYLKAGTILRHYSVVLVLLCRLRQLCCHPWLLRAKAGQINENSLTVTDDDIFAGIDEPRMDDISEVARAVTLMGQDWVDKVRGTLERRHQHIMQGSHAVKTENAELDEDDYSCPICMEPYIDERITACQHSFCAACIEDVINAPLHGGNDLTDAQVAQQIRFCPLCRSSITKDRLFRATAIFDPESLTKQESGIVDLDDTALDRKPKIEEIDVEDGSSSDRKGKKRASEDDVKPDIKKVRLDRGKGKARATDDVDELEEEEEDTARPAFGIEDVEPSTKMLKIGELLQEWREEDPTQKTLIFSSFVEMLDLMAIYLGRQNVNYVMFTGKLKPRERDDAIREFTNAEGGPSVMLISLKCGGVGLNLTAANKVIGLDLAWSPAAEAQAIDRAHRIGQTRPVTVKRLIVQNSVEDRIYELQQKKQALADGAMGEGTGGRLGRLTVHELVRLFGTDERDE